jgi:hypothetical protein
MSYNRDSVPHFVIKEASCGSVDIVDNGDYFVLYNNGDRWMVYNKDKDFEVKDMYSSYDLAYGDVIISGLGFGILALWLCSKPEVSSVTVIEVSEDVIKIFKDNNLIPEKLTIINDNMITYETDKEYDVLLLDHYERQTFDWRLKDINRICARINHKSFWAWSLEAIYLFKMYPGKIKNDSLNIYKTLSEFEGDLSILWDDFIDKFLPQEVGLKTLDRHKLKDYMYNYFDKDNMT